MYVHVLVLDVAIWRVYEAMEVQEYYISCRSRLHQPLQRAEAGQRSGSSPEDTADEEEVRRQEALLPLLLDNHIFLL